MYFNCNLLFSDLWVSELAHAINSRNQHEAFRVVERLMQYTSSVGGIDLQCKCTDSEPQTDSDQYMRCGIRVQSDLTEAVLYVMIAHQVKRVCGVSAQGVPTHKHYCTGEEKFNYKRFEEQCLFCFLVYTCTCT